MAHDINDPTFVLWLQQALARTVLGHVYVDPTGEFDDMTRKAINRYQYENGLARGDLNAETIARIEQDIAVLDRQPFKKKRRPAKGIVVGETWPTS